MVQIIVAINIAVATTVLYLALNNRTRFLYACAFLLPLQGLAIDVGVLLNWSKLVLPIAVIAHVLRSRTLFVRSRLPARMWYVLFLSYAIAITVLNILLHTHADQIDKLAALGAGPGQTYYRLHVQLATTILSWGVLVAASFFARDHEDAEGAVKGFIAGNLFSAAFGLCGLLASVAGLPWIGTVIFNNGESIGAFNTDGRLAGLAGEPKHAAAGFLFALLLLLWARRSTKFTQCAKKSGWKATLLVIALVLTLSTSGFLAASVALLYNAATERKSRASVFAAIVALILFGVMVTSPFGNTLRQRTVDRLQDPGRFEYKDAAFWHFAADEPHKLLLGAGAGGGDLNLMPYLDTYYVQKGIAPTYLIDEVLGDFGIIGLALLVCGELSLCGSLRRAGDRQLLHIIVMGTLVALLVPRFAIWGFVFVVGCLLAERSHNRATQTQASSFIC